MTLSAYLIIVDNDVMDEGFGHQYPWFADGNTFIFFYK